jgi:addiction module HigA family antidote
MAMKSPPHIGRVIWNAILDPLGLSVTKAAEILGVRRATLSDLVNGKSALTAEMALRIHKAFGPDVDHLLRMQVAYDVAQIQKRAKAIKVKRYRAVAKAA